MPQEIIIDGVACVGYRVQLPGSLLLFITAPGGLLGCGYFSIETADRVGEAVAVVTGVSSFEDMRRAPVARVSAAAAELGIAIGMSGEEALRRLGNP